MKSVGMAEWWGNFSRWLQPQNVDSPTLKLLEPLPVV